MHKIDDISYEEIFSYIDEFNDKDEDKMSRFREQCEQNNVPIIKKDVENFLRFYLNLIRPKKILEIGCAVGYSSIFMAKTLKDDVVIDTLEIDEETAKIARKNCKDFAVKNINIIQGDALSTIPTLKKKYDMVFIDASKGHYSEFYDSVQEKLTKNATIICDNMLFRGYLCMDISAIPKRFKTIYKRMNMFFEKIRNDSSISYNMLPLGDGLLVIKKED